MFAEYILRYTIFSQDSAVTAELSQTRVTLGVLHAFDRHLVSKKPLPLPTLPGCSIQFSLIYHSAKNDLDPRNCIT